MKNILKALCIILLAAPAASAQQITAESFKGELRAVIDDATAGFPKSMGSQTSTSQYGTWYTSRLSLSGGVESGRLWYFKSLMGSEEFSFTQYFKDSTAAGKFVTANAEDILDELAKKYHWKMGFKKQESEKYRRETRSEKHKIKEYRQNFRNMADITWDMPEGVNLTIHIYSPYRPKDVVMPNLLGCMVFSFPNMGFMYVVPVYGAALGDKEKVAAAAYAKSGLTERNYQYEWMPGTSAAEVQQKWGKQTRVTILANYNVD